MAKLIIGILLGAVLGGALVFFMFGGVPRAADVPGTPIQPPDASGVPAGTAQITLRQDFFNTVLGTIFRDMNDPAFPLGFAGQPGDSAGFAVQQQPSGCDGRITILEQGSGVNTGVVFENGTIGAPLAFAGNYDSPFGCIQFTGWAKANLQLRFDQAQQSVFGQINVETVNLDGVNPIISGLVTPIVQTTINNRVNPITVLDGRQIGVNLPIAATDGTLQAAVSDVRAEVKDNALNLYVTYNFSGSPAQ